jgi:hypothetical protein
MVSDKSLSPELRLPAVHAVAQSSANYLKVI